MSELPRVLLLGDSIRMSYQPLVAELLAARAEVVGPAENCQYSRFTREKLDEWLEQLGNPDVVHWNNGLHDVGHRSGREPEQYSLVRYLDNLRAILARLRRTGAAIVWATTTPVAPPREQPGNEWVWHNAEIDEYNAAAGRILGDAGLAINDLHAIVASDPQRYVSDDNIHLSDDGKAACTRAVADAVERALKKGTR